MIQQRFLSTLFQEFEFCFFSGLVFIIDFHAFIKSWCMRL